MCNLLWSSEEGWCFQWDVYDVFVCSPKQIETLDKDSPGQAFFEGSQIKMGFVIWFASGKCHRLQKGRDTDIQG